MRQNWNRTDLIRSHAILDEQGDARVEIPDVTLENKILLGLGGYLALQVS
jgi:hypothetical protein